VSILRAEALFCQACRAHSVVRIIPPDMAFTEDEKQLHARRHVAQMIMGASLTIEIAGDRGELGKVDLDSLREQTFSAWSKGIPQPPKTWRRAHPCRPEN
jgi:hypothetical protein